MMLLIIIIFSLQLFLSHPAQPINTINQTIAIQSTNQTYFSYIPLSSDCTYPNTSSIQLGNLQYTALDPLTIFQTIEVSSDVCFWGTMIDGIRMLVNQNQLLQNGTYTQVVLLNSSLQNNLTQRELILITFTIDGQIIFNYAQPTYNYTTNILTPTIISQENYALGDDIQKIVRDCNHNKNYIRIVYAGNNTFVGFCPNTTNLFSWSTQNNTAPLIYTNLSFLNGDNIQNITNNPTILLPQIFINTSTPQQIKQYDWNIVLLTQGVNSSYFCAANLSSLHCQSYQSQQSWLSIVIERGWGLQSALQLSQIELILSQFPSIINDTFPGNIISIFTYSNTIFIESSSNGTIYLSIFQNNQILANTSLPGEIIYYGRQNLIIESNNSFWLVDFLLPIYEISNSLPPLKQTDTLILNCTYTEYQINYNINWSNIIFPMFFIQQINQSPQISYQSVKIYNLNEQYLVIGPAFEIFINLDSNMNINLLDISELLGIDYFIDVVNIIFISQNAQINVPYQVIFINIQGILQMYRLGSQEVSNVNQPCGLNNFKSSFTLQNGFIFSNGHQICFCDQSLAACQVVGLQELPSVVADGTTSMGSYATTLSQILSSLSPSPSPSPSLTANAIKKQLLAQVNQDLIVNIYQNNTITLTNFQGKVIDYVQSGCIDYNSTDGTIFTRNFYDDYLLIYCYNRTTLTQYLIRNEQFVFNRVVPLYGFITTNHENSILSGQNYVFLQVDLDPIFFGTFKSKANDTSCCILRLDPDQFTVSVIAQIIPGNQLITVFSMYGVDVVFYNETEVSSSIPYIKVYFDSSWIAFSQSTVCTPQVTICTPVTYPYNISFISNFYNFAAAYNQNITFNISASIITFSGSSVQDVQMDRYIGNYIFFNSSVNYNFNEFCGPIASFHQHKREKDIDSIFMINQNNIITSNKEITNNYEPILQIMDIADYTINNTLSECILVVGIQNLTFYRKYSNIWMEVLEVVESTQYNCLYFVNQIIGNNTIQFGSNCYNLDISTPTITVTYDPSLNDSFNTSFGTMQTSVQLRQVTSIIQSNDTFLLGIQQGPSKSVSGVLYLCNFSACNSLTISTKVVFFIDYDQQLTQNGELLVVGLDIFKLSFWINPTINPSDGSEIPANFTIDYGEQLGYSCSKVKIVYSSLTTPNLILSCSTFYQQITVNLYQNTIITGLTFTKFSNCQQIDRFKPQIILQANTQSNIIFFAVQCQQSVNIVRLQQIYSLNTNTSIQIVTGYLLIYTSKGPQCSQNNWNPIRMINLGTSQEFSSYLIYQANGSWKILYEQINGILIDAFIDMQPNTYYQLIELTKQMTYPTITMVVQNPYFQVVMAIETAPQKTELSQTLFYIILSIFILFNSVTLICFICWCIFRSNPRKMPRLRFYSDADSKNIELITYTDPSSRLNRVQTDKQSRASSSNYQKASISIIPPQQGSMISRQTGSIITGRYQMKRKGTQIQLFQPR